MKIVQRFKYYGIGVLIGIGFVYALFGQRTDISCTYFPNSRVLSQLRQGSLAYSDSASCQYECLELDSAAMVGFWWYGDVDFRASEPRKQPNGHYWIEHKERPWFMKVENQDTLTLVLGFKGSDFEECDCN